jgi:energy-coupling factor transporter ATP-binding protein EcfA2
VRSPQLLIADEPTANLPPDASWEIMQLLGEINRRGVTVVVATHDSAVVDRTKRRVVELTEGRVVRDQRYGRFTPHGATNGAPSGAHPNGAPPGTPAGVPHGATNGAPAGESNGSAEHAAEPGSTLYPLLPPSGPSVLGRTTGQLGADSGLYPALAGADRPSL